MYKTSHQIADAVLAKLAQLSMSTQQGQQNAPVLDKATPAPPAMIPQPTPTPMPTPPPKPTVSQNLMAGASPKSMAPKAPSTNTTSSSFSTSSSSGGFGKTSGEIADSVLEKTALNLTQARQATGRALSNARGRIRGVIGVKGGKVVFKRRAKQLPKTELFKEDMPIGWGAVGTRKGPGGVGSAYAKGLKGMKGDPMRGIPSGDEVLKGLPIRQKGVPREPIFMAGDPMASAQSQVKTLRQLPGMGDAMDEMAQGIARPKEFTPEMHEMTNRILGLHELAERRAISRVNLRKKMEQTRWNTTTGVTHQSPEVLLQEHNMIQTLPKKMGPVREYFQKLRGTTDVNPLVIMEEAGAATGVPFQYGVSPRINRHTRKRITDAILNPS